jgi:hypothetical protein
LLHRKKALYEAAPNQLASLHSASRPTEGGRLITSISVATAPPDPTLYGAGRGGFLPLSRQAKDDAMDEV